MNLPKVTDADIERMVSALLRAGMTLAGMIVTGGGVLYLLRHGNNPVNYHVFHLQSIGDRAVNQIVRGALALQARSIIQTGVLLLILTPIARVAISLVGFALERDRVYVVITGIVLAVLLYSLISGVVGV